MQNVSRSLHTLWIIFKHEFSLFFVSPLVYLVGAFWLFVAGGFFARSLVIFNQGLAEPTMQWMLQPMVFLMIFVAPLLTMRMVAEEMRTGTHELLLTAPVRDWEVVVGKWLGVWAVFTLFMLVTLPYPFLLVWRGSPEQGLIITGYLALWLMSGATFAIGVFTSSLTQYQLIAGVMSVVILLFLWLSGSITSGVISNQVISTIMEEISLITHYNSLIDRALIRPIDLAYFIGMMAVFLFLATQVLNSRRWRS